MGWPPSCLCVQVRPQPRITVAAKGHCWHWPWHWHPLPLLWLGGFDSLEVGRGANPRVRLDPPRGKHLCAACLRDLLLVSSIPCPQWNLIIDVTHTTINQPFRLLALLPCLIVLLSCRILCACAINYAVISAPPAVVCALQMIEHVLVLRFCVAAFIVL